MADQGSLILFFFLRELSEGAQGLHLVDRGAGSIRYYRYSDTEKRQRHAGTYTYTNTQRHAHARLCTRTVGAGLHVNTYTDADTHYRQTCMFFTLLNKSSTIK